MLKTDFFQQPDLTLGTTAGTACAGNDARLSDPRPPSTHASTHSAGQSDAVSISNTQVSGLGGAAVLNVGTLTGTVCAGDDSRLTNPRTPTAHASTHGSGQDDAISIANTQVSGLGGAAVLSVGTTTGTVCAGDDSRLTNPRTPTAHAASHGSGQADAVSIANTQVSGLGGAAVLNVGSTTGTVCAGDDSRLTNTRTPTAHASTHGSGQADAITVAQSQVTNLTTALGDKAPLASPTFTGTPASVTAVTGTDTTQIATTAFVNASLGRKNLIINGDCLVNQRGEDYNLVKDAYTWDSTNLYGPERHEGMATGTEVSAGVWEQILASNITATKRAFGFTGVTLTGAGVLYHRYRMEYQDATRIAGKSVSFSCDVYHNVGSAINYTIYIRKADSQDNFSAVTAIGNSGAISVANTTSTKIYYNNVALGDCSNGLEVEIKIECGAVTTKNFEQSNLQLEVGAKYTNFEVSSFQEELDRCHRYCMIGDLNERGGIAESTTTLLACFCFPVMMRTSPTATFFNAGVAVNHVRKTANGADTAFTVPIFINMSKYGSPGIADQGGAPFTAGAGYDFSVSAWCEL